MAHYYQVQILSTVKKYGLSAMSMESSDLCATPCTVPDNYIISKQNGSGHVAFVSIDSILQSKTRR